MANTYWFTGKFTGLDKVERDIRYIKSTLQTQVDRIMLQAALILEAEVKKLITDYELVDTGTLRASVHSFVRNNLTNTEGVVGTNMEYAPFLEYGTGRRGAASGHPAVPADYKYGDSPGIRSYKYMWNAWWNKKDEIQAFIAAELKKVIK